MKKILSAILSMILLFACSACQKNSQINESNNNISSEQVQNIQSEDVAPWYLLLVNPWNAVPDNYSVVLMELRNGYLIDERIYPDLQQMFDDARASGIHPLIVSAYRTQEKQEALFQEKVSSYISAGYARPEAEEKAGTWVAKPGFSEHQTGLAIDINAENGSSDTMYQWLSENSYKYGFILRYPQNKTNITGISYEPWHFRYVGKTAANYIYENNLTLEEYLSINGLAYLKQGRLFLISFLRRRRQ